MIALTKWQMQRFAVWFVPLLVWLVLFGALNLRFRAEGGSRMFVDDAAYRHIVMADSIQGAQAYQLRGREPIPMTHDVIWRGLMAIGIGRMGDGITTALGLGLLGTALSLLLLLSFSGKLCPYTICLGMTAAYAVLSPPLYRVGFSGGGGILAVVLILLAVQRHVDDLTRTGKGMPFSSALLVGLALWIRMELVLVWIALWVHTLLMASAPHEEKLSLPAVVFRGITGLLYMALFILPMLSWNQQVVGVPWPRLPEVPLAANIWAIEGPAAAWQATTHWMQVGATRIWEVFRTHALPAGVMGMFFALVGTGLLIWRGLQGPRDRRYQILWILPIVLWLFLIPLYPYMGSGSWPIMAAVTAPFMIVLAAYGAVYVPLQFGRQMRHWLPQWPPQRVFALWWGVAGALLLAEALWAQGGFIRRHSAALRAVAAAREQVADVVHEQHLARDRFITDQPGWLVWQHRVAIIDLTGEWSPSLLAAIDLQGGFDRERLAAYFDALTVPPTAAVLWDPAYHVHAQWIQEVEVLSGPDEGQAGAPLVVIGEASGVL